MNKRDKIVTALAIILIIGTMILIVHVFPIYYYYQKADQIQKNPTCNDILACSNRTIAYLVPYQDGSILLLYGTANFTSKNAFFVTNQINYTILFNRAGSGNQIFNIKDHYYDFKQTYLVIASKGTNIDNYKRMQPQFLLNILPRNNTIVHLQLTSADTLYAKGSFTISNPDEMMVFVVVYGTSLYNATISESLGNIFKVETQTIGSEARLSHQTEITTLQITWLTYLGVALLPTLLGADMILRVAFEGEKSSKNKNTVDKKVPFDRESSKKQMMETFRKFCNQS